MPARVPAGPGRDARSGVPAGPEGGGPARVLAGPEGEDAPDRQGGVQLLERTRVQRPRRFRVLLHNDDYTPREFVVIVLCRVFRKGESEAAAIMRHAHRMGLAQVGIYAKEIAETKVEEAGGLARAAEMPLQFSMEPDDGDDEG